MAGTTPASSAPRFHQASWWARAALLAALVLGTPGTVLNDEHDQATALHNLANGSLAIEEHVEDEFRRPESVRFTLRYNGTQPVGSTLLDYLAYPALVAVKAVDEVASLSLWLCVAAVFLARSLLPTGSRLRRPWVAAAAFALLASGFRFPEMDVEQYGPVLALQLTNMLILAATAFLVVVAIQRHIGPPALHVPVAAVLIGPLVFWGSRLKYSLLAAAIVAALLVVAAEAPSRRRNAAAGLLAALAAWNNIGEGAVVVLAGLAWLVVETLRQPKPRPWLRWWAPALAGLLVGLVPFALENIVLRGSPFAVSYIAPYADGAPSSSAYGSPLLDALALGIALELWQGPVDFLANLVGAWTTGWRVEGEAIGVLAWSPLLAAGFVAVARRDIWRRPDLLLAVLLILAHVLLLTNRVVRQGAGFDARLLLPMLPALGLLAAPVLARFLGTHGPAEARAVRRTLSLWTLVGLVFFLWAASQSDRGLRSWTNDRILAWTWVLLTLAMAASLAVARRWGILRPSPAGQAQLAGLLLGVPAIVLLLASVGGGTVVATDEGELVRGFLPVTGDARTWARPFLFPAGEPPVVTDGSGRVIFHPDYGYCDVDPSPCPWWTSGNATGLD